MTAYITQKQPSPPYGNPGFPDLPRIVGSWNRNIEIGNIGTHLSLFYAFPCVVDWTMPCTICHSKNAESDDFLSLGEADRCALR